MRPRRDHGFSMIELLVVVAIAIALLGWGYPRLSVLAQKYRLDGAAWALSTDLQKIRLRAIQEGRSFQVLFNTSAKSYQIQKQTAGGTWANEGPAQRIEDAGTIALATSANPVFSTRGILQTPALITLTAPGGATRNVFVELQGQIFVQ